jgi:predicted Rossmann fold flavoprotein
VQQPDVIVLGAGAAGLMCAIEAGRRGRRVLVLDHADRAGKKILISGGGRCNFTNLHCRPENFLSENPHFARSALARYTAEDFVAKVEQHNIPYHEKTLGQLFCDRSSRDILSMLERECSDAKVHIELGVDIIGVKAEGNRSFTVATSTGPLHAESLVVATGGLSIPKMGATDFGYRLARQFGLSVVACRPALVPFTFSAEDRERWCDLAGISMEVVASVDKRGRRGPATPAFREKMLITHRGLSGPAILQISSFWRPADELILDLAPDQEVFLPMLEPGALRFRAAAYDVGRSNFPARWAERWIGANLSGEPILSNASIREVEERLHAWRITPAGTEGYAKAEVTAGGVDTSELDAKTMQARAVPGLFFIGEVVDVTGWLGGYNFQWAWASGFCAGQVA